MKDVSYTELIPGSSRERLPNFDADFPHISTRAKLSQYSVPWHWHEPVELFFVESGELEYMTPGGVWRFPEGSGGFVNSNVLHKTNTDPSNGETIQLLHIFHPSLISGLPHGRIERRYFFTPLRDKSLEVLPIYPESAEQTALLDRLRASFLIKEEDFGYELRVCAALCEIWARLASLAALAEAKRATDENKPVKNDDKLKQMMIYIHDHCAEKITVDEIAGAGYVSQRECFRLFHDCMRITPVQYLISYRLQMACRMLVNSEESAADIALACGFGDSGYFGRAFQKQFGITPRKYRTEWRDKTINRQS